jgi:hypothetical protein
MTRRALPTLLLVLAAVGLPPALAENSTQVPGYTIHHNVITTDKLTPDVARSYGIQRSRNRGLLNVSVIKDVPGTTGTPVVAEVKASSRNLQGVIRELPMREVRDGSAVYYLAEFPVQHQETLSFKVQVRPQGETTSHTAELSQEFFTR